MHIEVPFILASGSPRRRDLLTSIGLSFIVDVSDVDENGMSESESPDSLVEKLATAKAAAVAHRHPDALVLGADTVVVLDGKILGKPADRLDARNMLRSLSGRSNTVFTGLSLVHRPTDRCVSDHEVTRVTFADLTDDEIAKYVDSGAPLDKAGGYGIQSDLGALFIEGIEGDYFNVVGLPLHRMYTLIRSHFPDLLRL
jgi:septum formation protein